MKIPPTTLERFIPDEADEGDVTGAQSIPIRMRRYEFAIQHAKPNRILDMACGVGYGTFYLAENMRSNTFVTGVDISIDAISYACERYNHKNIKYICADATQFFDAEGFDTVISIETIEHISHPRAFISHLAQLVKPGGMLITSVPTTPSMDANPYHVNDFTPKTFRAMFYPHRLQEIDYLKQVQHFNPINTITRKESKTKDLRKNLLSYYLHNPNIFFRRVRSTLLNGFNNHYTTIAWQKPK